MFFNRIIPVLGFCGLLAAPSPAPAGGGLDIRLHEAAAPCGAQSPQIEVIVGNVTARGILAVELYRPSQGDFLRKASRLHRIRVPAQEGPQTVCFDIEGAGRYAIAAYQDLNADRNLDRKWNMMPAEPFALSGNKSLAFRMPVFEDAAFEVPPEGASIRITLQR